ncbi:MAG: pitrilysin family protein [Bacteroidales bacterium]
MISFQKHQLQNGLRVLLHQDTSTDIAAVNLMYNVGSRDENKDVTGLAHLFEHLMFEGSEHVPEYDRELEWAGGENNAFTNNDVTNYYQTLPALNLDTALWLEADRMQFLNLTQKKLDIQKSVVIEEFKERYLNQPYGDVMALVRSLSYKVHPYQWSTIGKKIDHISQVDLTIALNFYRRFYAPDNAVLAIASPLEPKAVLDSVDKWFGDIPAAAQHYERNLPQEPPQKEARFMEVTRDVPSSMFVRTYPMAARLHAAYYIHDLISDVLSDGESSRFKTALVKQQEIFSQVDAYISGDIDPGLFVIAGKLNDHVSLEDARIAVDNELDKLVVNGIEEKELQKAKNKALMRLEEEKSGVLEKAMNLAYFEILGDIDLLEKQALYYQNVSPKDFQEACHQLFAPENQNTLFYKAQE